MGGANQQAVSLVSDTDLGTGGLVLDSSNSPATVGDGATLVLRNGAFPLDP